MEREGNNVSGDLLYLSLPRVHDPADIRVEGGRQSSAPTMARTTPYDGTGHPSMSQMPLTFRWIVTTAGRGLLNARPSINSTSSAGNR